VAGFDVCLNALNPQDAEVWLEEDLRPRHLGFRDEYQGKAGLIFWLPPSRKRIQTQLATEDYAWTCGGLGGALPVGSPLQCLLLFGQSSQGIPKGTNLETKFGLRKAGRMCYSIKALCLEPWACSSDG
jgi:hypothetical protein